jgi:hypothetical protein
MVGTSSVSGNSSPEARSASLEDKAERWNEILQEARQANGDAGSLPDAPAMEAGGPLQSQVATGGNAAKPQQTALEFIASPDISKITKLSPTLTQALKDLQSAGWTIRWAKDGEQGTYSIGSQKLIVLDPASARNPEEFVSDLAHEVGHAKYDGTYSADSGKPLPPREDFINDYVNAYLRHEGEATLTQLQVHDEILSAGGPELPFRPGRGKAYQIMYRGFKNGRTREQQATAIGRFYGDNERPSNDPKHTYSEYYEGYAGRLYDALQKAQKLNVATPKQPDVIPPSA